MSFSATALAASGASNASFKSAAGCHKWEYSARDVRRIPERKAPRRGGDSCALGRSVSGPLEEVVEEEEEEAPPQGSVWARLWRGAVELVRGHKERLKSTDWDRELKELREFAESKVRENWRPESLAGVVSQTKFTAKEVKVIYRAFKQSSPSGTVSREEFNELFASLFPYGDSDAFAQYIFETFDSDHNGAINFEEFVRGLSVVSRGSVEEKLLWIFNLYDMNGNGNINYQELRDIVLSVSQIVGASGNPPITDDAIDKHTTEVFQKLDLDGDGVVSKEEFLKGCLADRVIIKSISVFNTVF